MMQYTPSDILNYVYEKELDGKSCAGFFHWRDYG